MAKSAKLTEQELGNLKETTKKLRKNIVNMIATAKSGHPGGSLSAIDILTVLYLKCMNHSSEWLDTPKWNDRDRFILSKGHASPALYSVLAECGYIQEEELKTFRAINSRLQGHPAYGHTPGVEASTGSLGQGLSVANGMALALKMDKNPARVYVVLGDGETQEGQVWEAAMTTAHYKLNNVTAILDRNCLQIDGKTECVMSIEPVEKKWEAFGWQVLEIDGHDIEQIYDAVEKSKEISQEKNAPVIIIANTVKGKGVSFMENNAGWHGKAPSNEECLKALEELGC